MAARAAAGEASVAMKARDTRVAELRSGPRAAHAAAQRRDAAARGRAARLEAGVAGLAAVRRGARLAALILRGW